MCITTACQLIGYLKMRHCWPPGWRHAGCCVHAGVPPGGAAGAEGQPHLCSGAAARASSGVRDATACACLGAPCCAQMHPVAPKKKTPHSPVRACMHPSLPLITKLCSNFLNHGNARLGGASGFRLKNLDKLADTRSVVRGAVLPAWPGAAGRRQYSAPACCACPLLVPFAH